MKSSVADVRDGNAGSKGTNMDDDHGNEDDEG
jgi:hypothetical protein